MVPVWCRCVAVQTLLVWIEYARISTLSVAAMNSGSLALEDTEERRYFQGSGLLLSWRSDPTHQVPGKCSLERQSVYELVV